MTNFRDYTNGTVDDCPDLEEIRSEEAFETPITRPDPIYQERFVDEEEMEKYFKG